MHTLMPLPGDIVWIRQQRWRVERALRDRSTVRLDVASGNRRRTFLAPFDKLRPATQGQGRWLMARPQMAGARMAGLLAGSPDVRLPLSLLHANVEILPHQIEPALAMIAGRTRMLLADDVGLGKTIEAALVVAELVRRDAAPRVIIIVPSTLRDQWSAELRQRFSIDVLSGDRDGIEAVARIGTFGANPWKRCGVWLASPDFLKQPRTLESLSADPWDLVVIDEAHIVCGDSDRYKACEAVARNARRVLLLTATPHSGDAQRYGRLIALGRLSDSDEPPVLFRRTRAELGYPRTRRVRWHGVALNDAETNVLTQLFAFERAALAAAPGRGLDNVRLLLSVFRKRALSTFAALSRSLTRRLSWLGEARDDLRDFWQQPQLSFSEDADTEPDEIAILTAPIGLDARHERSWLRRLRDLADEAARHDSKIARVFSLITRTTEPVVVFSEFRDSLVAIQQRLRQCRAMTMLHGGQTAEERRAALTQYLRGPCSVLLATDVAGQGLNLQSRGRWVISVELPWNPARLEQRVGRVDRLGQSREPHFTVLFARHPAESGLLRHLAERVLRAQRALSSDVLEDVVPPEAQLRSVLLSQGDPNHSDIGAASHQRDPGNAEVVARTARARWQRSARVVARALMKRRELARHWRHETAVSGRTMFVRRRFRSIPGIHSRDRSGSSVILCSVPIVTGDGELVERVAIALAVPHALRERHAVTQSLQAARLSIDRIVRRRLAKATARISRSATRRLSRELELLHVICERRAHRQAQPGLFTAAALRDFESRIDEDRRLEDAARERIESLGVAAVLRAEGIDVTIVLCRLR